jgi:type IV pilus assembly protein PilQ
VAGATGFSFERINIMDKHKLSSFPKAFRGALVLCLVCAFAVIASATTTNSTVARTLTANVTGANTRITITGSAPMAYTVRRTDARTLVVDLPGVDASPLHSNYTVGSSLVGRVSVERAAQFAGSLGARLTINLRAPARDRSQLADNNFVLELSPEGRTTPQVNPTPVPLPGSNFQPQTSPTPQTSSVPQSQGEQYGRPGFVGEPINLNVNNADIRDILQFITEQYGVNFVIDNSVGAVPVTVNVTDVPWNVALDAILRANRLGIEVTGNILRVATLQVLAAEASVQQAVRTAQLNASPLVTEFIRLNYARASGTLAGAAGTTGGFAGGVTSGTSGGAAGGGGDVGILPIIARRLSARGSVEVDGRSNTLIVTDVRENIEPIRQLITLLDQPEPQVEIETRIVIASRSFSRDLGAQLSAGIIGTGGALGNFSTLPSSSGTGGGSGGAVQTGPNRFGVFGGLDGTTQPTSSLAATAANTVIGLTTGAIGTAQISLLITAAEARGQARVVANPRVTALNNRSAEIESGSQIPVVTPQASGGSGGGAVFTTTFVSVPLRLSVTPQITDAGTVVLRVVAENNSVNLSLTNGLGTPGIDTQRMQTEVLVPDGGTTVVGGVLSDLESNTQNRTPGLGSVPIIGNLFRRRATQRSSSEILFFITPRIYRPDYQGRPTAGTVSDRTRSTQIVQPVPLGNPPSNTPVQTGQPTVVTPTVVTPAVVTPTTTPATGTAPASQPGATGIRP